MLVGHDESAFEYALQVDSVSTMQGAAFGFGMIAKQAGEQLAPVLHRIVPKLYRYQFDPNPKIQGAMSSIWTALVTDQKKMVSGCTYINCYLLIKVLPVIISMRILI